MGTQWNRIDEKMKKKVLKFMIKWTLNFHIPSFWVLVLKFSSYKCCFPVLHNFSGLKTHVKKGMNTNLFDKWQYSKITVMSSSPHDFEEFPIPIPNPEFWVFIDFLIFLALHKYQPIMGSCQKSKARNLQLIAR